MASYVICRFFRNSPPQTLHDFLHLANINFGLSKHSPLSAQAEHLPTTFASSSQVSMVKIFLLCEQINLNFAAEMKLKNFSKNLIIG